MSFKLQRNEAIEKLKACRKRDTIHSEKNTTIEKRLCSNETFIGCRKNATISITLQKKTFSSPQLHIKPTKSNTTKKICLKPVKIDGISHPTTYKMQVNK